MIRKQRVKIIVIGLIFNLVKCDLPSRFIVVKVHRYELLLYKVLLTLMIIGERGCAEYVSLSADLLHEIFQISTASDLGGTTANSCTDTFNSSSFGLR